MKIRKRRKDGIVQTYNIKLYQNKREEKIINYYTSSRWMEFQDFIEIEVKERKKYTINEIKRWIKKYNLRPDSLVIWVSPYKWMANRYNLLSEEWGNAEKIPESEMNIEIIYSNQGFIIKESNDGDHGYLFVKYENN